MLFYIMKLPAATATATTTAAAENPPPLEPLLKLELLPDELLLEGGVEPEGDRVG